MRGKAFKRLVLPRIQKLAERVYPQSQYGLRSKPGFPKKGHVVPLGAMIDTQGARKSKGVKGGQLTVKEPKRGYEVIADEEQKKSENILGVFNVSLETYTIYS